MPDENQTHPMNVNIGYEEPTMTDQTLDTVRDYYGKVLETQDDLKTSACCTDESPPEYLKALLGNVHEVVQARFYGCGSPVPPAVEGCTVLDLGCGSGRDAYLLSQLVGPHGRVIGIDMTVEQLDVANEYAGWHTDRFGYDRPNVQFVHGYIEDLAAAGLADESVDVVVSNCVINLSPDKPSVFREIMRVLKPGGELYFSDVFADRRVPPALRYDPVLLGECLAGAIYTEDFRRLLAGLGVPDCREVSRRLLTLDDPTIEALIGMVAFESRTVRAFKVDLEDRCENFGHVAYYLGTVPESPHRFMLDDHHLFEKGIPVPVCGNTANMLASSRFGRHFRVEGDFSTHYGLFDCAPSAAAASPSEGCC